MKTDKNFRLSKRSKTMIALLCNSADERSHLRAMLTESQAAMESAQRQSLRSTGKKSKGSSE
jgi:hypothetical protein